MRRLSLRGWLLFVSILFTMLVVGGIALTTFVIVSGGMQEVARDTTTRISATALAVIDEVVRDAEAEAAGLTGAAREARASEYLREQGPAFLRGAGLDESEFALYAPDGSLLWSTGHDAVYPEQSALRRIAVTTGNTTISTIGEGDPFAGLISAAQLRKTVAHERIRLPGGAIGALDVTYVPRNEEAIIDRIRLPMAILAVSAMIIMVVLMQTSMAWVLNLVDELRRAADSIDAGRLDERIPYAEDNEIGQLAQSINRLLERLQRRAEAQSRFVADASHELATPVAGIRGYTSILRAWGAGDEKVRTEAIDAIDRESRRMARLTNDLLNLLHADQGLRLKTERFDLNVLARERLAAIASKYLEKDMEFVGPEEESLVMVGDPERVEDVLSILLDNAGKYTPAGGRVGVVTRRRRETVSIEVSDTGPGISEDALAHIFDRFFRSDSARTQGEGGFGLGLAIAKSIVNSMGGEIVATSVVGEGTTFVVTLPRGRLS